MTTARYRLAFLFTSLCVALACGPIGPVPGGRLSGDLAPRIPSDWTFTDDYDTAQLETGGDDPYSVNVWVTAVNGDLYTASSGEGSGWARRIEADPKVRLRIDGVVYELRAERLELTPDLQSDFLAAVKRKYGYEVDEDDMAGAWLYRLQPR